MNEDQDKPQDLSIKSTGSTRTAKKIKPIPPPLDLNACNLEEPSDLRTPKSPGDLPRECLPLRKRPLLDQRRDLNTKSPKSAGPADRITFSAIDFNTRSTNTAPSSPAAASVPSYPFLTPSSTSALTLTPSSASSVSAFAPFPLPPPPPLIPPPGSGSTSAAAAAAAATSLSAHAQLMAAAIAAYQPKSPFATASGGFPTPPTELAGASYPWASPTALGMFPHSPFSPVVPISPLPFPSTAMLSPAPSHPSSTNSSREDLPLGSNSSEESKRRYFPSTSASNAVAAIIAAKNESPSSPLLSPLARSWPTPSWQCFMAGSKIRFLLPNTSTPWQKAEELGWKDRIALKVDSRNSYQFAPNGLAVLKIDIVTTDTVDPTQPSKESESQTVLLLRMGPHRCDNAPDILVECSLNHPFFVKDKGWSSVQPRLTFEKYGIPCRELSIGDVCLPPDHQDVVRTPDLCDRFRMFEFSVSTTSTTATATTDSTTESGSQPSRSSIHRPVAIPGGIKNHHAMSPPTSPARKKEKDPDKPKRPMNGFMLFAKKYRLELIQQHPGKDNRAISVLLGEAWKGLPSEEREQYSQRAKLLADEQKKLYPDCWKRKRTMANSNKESSPSHQQPPPPPIFGASSSSSSPMIGSTNLIKQEGST